jgi:hypothetical protein
MSSFAPRSTAVAEAEEDNGESVDSSTATAAPEGEVTRARDDSDLPDWA